jgi:DNA-binding PadR family transcriptional regulator
MNGDQFQLTKITSQGILLITHFLNIVFTSMSPRQQAPLTLEYILLGFINQNPMHGYELFKEVSRLDGVAMIWRVKQSQLYALLDKLQTDGLLNSVIIPGETRPARTQYHLTPAGRDLFLAWVRSPVEDTRDMRQNFLARLFFALNLDQDAAHRLVEQQIIICQEWLAKYQQQLSGPSLAPYQDMVLKFQITQTQAMLEWLEYSQRKLC